MDAIQRQQLQAAMQQADDMAAQHDDFIRKHRPVIYKENENALVSAVEPEPHLIDDDEFVKSVGEVAYQLRQEFQSGDKLLRQRIAQLEEQVTELSSQLSIFSRVATSFDTVLQAALVWIKQSSK